MAKKQVWSCPLWLPWRPLSIKKTLEKPNWLLIKKFLNTNLFLMKMFFITKFDCIYFFSLTGTAPLLTEEAVQLLKFPTKMKSKGVVRKQVRSRPLWLPLRPLSIKRTLGKPNWLLMEIYCFLGNTFLPLRLLKASSV